MSRAREIADLGGSAEAGGVTGRNLIINGAMQVWQRGTSQTITGFGCVDRWSNTVSGTTTFSQDTSGLPSNFEYALRWTTGASSSYGQSRQYLETSTVKIIRGQTIALSAYVKVSGTYSGVVTWEIAYSTTSDASSGNTWTQFVETNVVSASASDASSDYKRISCNVTIPSNALGLYIGIVPSAVQASGEWVSVTGVKCELGTTITTFQREPFETTLQKCQRYFCKSYEYNIAPGASASLDNLKGAAAVSGGTTGVSRPFWFAGSFHVKMRTVPTVTLYHYDGTSGQITGASFAAFSGTAANIGERGFNVYRSSGSTTADADHYCIFAANAEL